MKFLTVSVVASFFACIVFTTICIVLGCIGYQVSDTLIQYFFTVFGVEFAVAGAIQIFKYKLKRQEIQDNIENLKENNLPVEHDDVVGTTDSSYGDTYYDDGTVYG